MRAILAGLILFGAGYLWLTWQIPLDPWADEEAINTRTLPLLYGSALCLLAAVLLARQLFAGAAARETLTAIPRAGLWRLGGLFAAMVLFAVLVPRLGIWLAIPVLLVPAMFVMGERRWWALMLLPIATALAGWFVVEALLELHVPAGRWLVG